MGYQVNDIVKIKNAVRDDHIVFKKYALTRMLERKILSDDIQKVLVNFIVLEEYYNDKPFSSFLVLGYAEERPIHAVVSYDSEYEIIYIITIYEPSIELWGNNFTERRKRV